MKGVPDNSSMVIYQTEDGQTQLEVRMEEDSVWLTQNQMAELFTTDRTSIVKHIRNIYQTEELSMEATCAKIAQVQIEGERSVTRDITLYNLDVIISVGYRVKSKQGIKFRIWANRILKEYLIKGYAINEDRLKQKQQEIESLKTGIRILNRALAEQSQQSEDAMLQLYAKGLELLDDYDHEALDTQGSTQKETIYPTYDMYTTMIREMYSDFESDVFAQPKDDTFHSSINQIQQTFGGEECYPTLEEKAAVLLYLIVKNHSFVDGNKRIGAACFLYFLKENQALFNSRNEPIISNEALASLTLFIATSKTEEMNIVKQFVISILNRNR